MPTSYFPAAKSFDDQRQHQDLLRQSDYEGFSKKMINTIDVQEVDVNLYMSKELWQPVGSRGVFGGCIVAQALRAAWYTVPDNFHIHSLHSYFILAGDVDIPVIYNVQRLREGRSFSTRFVTATQRGKPIFVCSCSFSTISNAVNAQHFTPMPNDVPDPESLLSEDERTRRFLTQVKDIPPVVKDMMEKRLAETQAVLYKDTIYEDDPVDMIRGDVEPRSNSQRWFKTRELVESDDPKVHAGIIAYASDAGILATAVYANGLGISNIGMMASLDHSIWFHHPCRADEWLLHDMHSPCSSEGRGTSFGRIYTRDGILVATTAQEGIIRLSKKEQRRRLQQSKSDLDISTGVSENASKL
ncbi:HotDog domain-containing protein [Halteromyces radiatus]|uniref:HotDog domain-containing protein n=1 Tax=Halteromyces radiatus TaxID=101107 RepID=UPI00221EC5E9|nr:HotDog domain-containing protein [Halteromyces radiatus]KAI8093165.1 HotDog domain-containing protein [Halteromyces radiatus]